MRVTPKTWSRKKSKTKRLSLNSLSIRRVKTWLVGSSRLMKKLSFSMVILLRH